MGTDPIPCPAPQGYSYESDTDKFYRPVKEKKTWDDAWADCFKDEANLIEHRTVAEHEVLKDMLSKFA